MNNEYCLKWDGKKKDNANLPSELQKKHNFGGTWFPSCVIKGS